MTKVNSVPYTGENAGNPEEGDYSERYMKMSIYSQ